MAIPSGSGTEVLKRVYGNALSNAWTDILTGTANHIYTIISIVACETGSAAETISFSVDIGGTDLRIVTNQSLPSDGTFTFNDKLVLTGTDKLKVYNTAGAVDWYVSYIDQDWT